jgi:uncharacterized protein DUF4124
MKLLSFTILILSSLSSYAVEFYRCIDDNGVAHFTNLPKSSLDSNCAAKDRYSLMLDQDYSNLATEFNKYEVSIDETSEEIELSVDSMAQSVKNVFDPDKAFEELMSVTEDRDDAFTRAMRGRSKGVDDIMSQSRPNTP